MVSVVALTVAASAAHAQELIPAAYVPAPVGINLVTVAGVYNSGDLSFDPALPIEDASARIIISSLGYARTLNVAGRSANITVVLPYLVGDLEGVYIGEQRFVERSGLGDAGLRFGVNLLGAPAMTPEQFRSFRPGTLLGASLTLRAPVGQYDPSKLINIGTNRWAFKPELGLTQVIGRWALEAYIGGWFFTTNSDLFGGRTGEQDPILSTQYHVRFLIRPGLWAALDANFWRGGRTTVNGLANDDLQRNSRIGATVSVRLAPAHSLRIAASRGAITRIGGDFNSAGVSYAYTWMAKPRSK